MRARVAGAVRTMDYALLLTWGGGLVLGLVGVAAAGFYLPGLVRLGLLAVGAGGVRALGLMRDGPERAALRPALVMVVVWLGLAWGLGLIEPFVAAALVGLIAGLARVAWQYAGDVAELEAAAPEPAPEPAELTPDEELDALLEDAPLEGLGFSEILAALGDRMSRSTLHTRLKERAWRVGHGRWRAKPKGVS